jgi:glycosyltransferase involved in cell wall biosynthesis
MIKPIVSVIWEDFKEVEIPGLLIHNYNLNTNLNKIIEPDVYVSIGSKWNIFNQLISLPFHKKYKWLHLDVYDDTFFNRVMNKYFDTFNIPNTKISIFTSAYNIGPKILKTWDSIKNQTYQNWEWVIYDDSKNIDTWITLKNISKDDNRVKIFKSDKNIGIIGECKRRAASLTTGNYILELDHDDILTPDCLESVVKAFESDSSIGFVYSDYIIYDKDGDHNYGDNFSFGWGSYYNTYIDDCWRLVVKSSPINCKTLSHIVGVPNHLRAWRKDVYLKIGGHNPNLHVADDYELILKTFIETKFYHINKPLYFQTLDRDSTTNKRNAEIQKFVDWIWYKYEDNIRTRIIKLSGYIYKENIGHDQWCDSMFFHSLEKRYDTDNIVSVIIPTKDRPEDLVKAINSVLSQTIDKIEVIVVGDGCSSLSETMKQFTDKRIKWYNFKENKGESYARNYGIRFMSSCPYIAYLDDDNYWEPNHLEVLLLSISDTDSKWGFSSFIIDGKDLICDTPVKGRIDTSSIIHHKDLIEEYGGWYNREQVGYAVDWNLVSRWLDEKWVATKLPTLHYNTKYNNQTYESIFNMVS